MKDKAIASISDLHKAAEIDLSSKPTVFYSKFGLKAIVFLKTDIDQMPRLITEIMFRGDGAVTYSVTCGTTVSAHYDYELSKEADILKKC